MQATSIRFPSRHLSFIVLGKLSSSTTQVNCSLQLYMCCHLSSFVEELVIKSISFDYWSNISFELKLFQNSIIYVALKRPCVVECLLSILVYKK